MDQIIAASLAAALAGGAVFGFEGQKERSGGEVPQSEQSHRDRAAWRWASAPVQGTKDTTERSVTQFEGVAEKWASEKQISLQELLALRTAPRDRWVK